MAITTIYTYPLNGTQRDFTIPFEYLARRFVAVTLIGANRRELTLTADFRFLSKTLVQMNVAWGPADGYERIEIRRNTSATDRLVDFADGSILRASELNTSQVQTLHVAEEARNMVADTISTNQDGDLDARGRRLVNLADAEGPDHAVTLRQEQAWAQSTLGNRNAAEAAAELSKASENAAKLSETNSKASENAAKLSETNSKASENAAAEAAAGLRLPPVSIADAGRVLKVRADGSGFELVVIRSGPLLGVRWVLSRSLIDADEVPLDGQIVNRSDYPDAWPVIQGLPALHTAELTWESAPTQRAKFTKGNGSTTLRVPDFNGKSPGSLGALFLRGDGTLSAGPGIIQQDAFQGHKHDTNRPVVMRQGSDGAFDARSVSANADDANNNSLAVQMLDDPVANSKHGAPRTAEETRPLNVGGCWVVRLR